MANPLIGPRKQRTRQHVIADLSVHHVERFILEEGHTAQGLGSDHGYDLVLFSYDEQATSNLAPCSSSSKQRNHWQLSERATMGKTDVTYGQIDRVVRSL